MIEPNELSRGARIRLLKRLPVQPSWCWRPQWVFGGESFYGLLALFQDFNVVQANRITSEFVFQRGSARGPIAKAPSVDLHSPDRIHIDHFARVTGLAVDAVQRTFLTGAFPRSGWQGAPFLRWCPECLKSHFHALIFQVPIVHRCPGHGLELLERCPRCRTELPYKLHGSCAALPLYCCVACKLDLLQGLRTSTVCQPLDKAVATAIHAEASLLELCDSLPTRTAGVLTGARSMGYRELVLSVPRGTGDLAEFADFARAVMRSLAGHFSKVHLTPSLSYAEPYGVLTGKCTEAPSMSCGWPKHQIPRSDRHLVQAACIYRVVSRHLRKDVLRAHRQCFHGACKRLWWPILASSTTGLCPVALAFIRWRMHWEGTSVPSLLLAEPRSAPLGLVTWLASTAPVGSASWTNAMSEWLMLHVLARDLLASFDSLLRQARHSVQTDSVVWSRLTIAELPRTGWVCAGRGTVGNLGRLFVMAPSGDISCHQSLTDDETSHRAHLRWHADCLRRLEH